MDSRPESKESKQRGSGASFLPTSSAGAEERSPREASSASSSSSRQKHDGSNSGEGADEEEDEEEKAKQASKESMDFQRLALLEEETPLPDTPVVRWLTRLIERRPPDGTLRVSWVGRDGMLEGLRVLPRLLPADLPGLEIELPSNQEPTDQLLMPLLAKLSTFVGLNRFMLRCTLCSKISDFTTQAIFKMLESHTMLTELGLDFTLCEKIGNNSLKLVGSFLQDRATDVTRRERRDIRSRDQQGANVANGNSHNNNNSNNNNNSSHGATNANGSNRDSGDKTRKNSSSNNVNPAGSSSGSDKTTGEKEGSDPGDGVGGGTLLPGQVPLNTTLEAPSPQPVPTTPSSPVISMAPTKSGRTAPRDDSKPRSLRRANFEAGPLEVVKAGLLSVELSFHGCTQLTDDGIDALASGLSWCKPLKALRLDVGALPAAVSSMGFKSLLHPIVSMSKLEELVLNAQHSIEFYDSSFVTAVSAASNKAQLKLLNMNFQGCSNVASQSLHGFKELFRHSQQLQSFLLDISECSQIQDKHLQELCGYAKSSPELASFSLRVGGTKVSVGGLLELESTLKETRSVKISRAIRANLYCGVTHREKDTSGSSLKSDKKSSKSSRSKQSR